MARHRFFRSAFFFLLAAGFAGAHGPQEPHRAPHAQERPERPEGRRSRPTEEPRRHREERGFEGRRLEGFERRSERREGWPEALRRPDPPQRFPQDLRGFERRPEPSPRIPSPQLPSPRAYGAPPTRNREETQAWQSRGGWRQGAWQPHGDWREHGARHWEAEHRTWSQRGGYGGYSIPEARFQGSFGARNPFCIGYRPAIYQGYPRFWLRGFWFQIVDPWPVFWGVDWYADDDVYVDYYLDGYYLFNRRHPGVALALTVSL